AHGRVAPGALHAVSSEASRAASPLGGGIVPLSEETAPPSCAPASAAVSSPTRKSALLQPIAAIAAQPASAEANEDRPMRGKRMRRRDGESKRFRLDGPPARDDDSPTAPTNVTPFAMHASALRSACALRDHVANASTK